MTVEDKLHKQTLGTLSTRPIPKQRLYNPEEDGNLSSQIDLCYICIMPLSHHMFWPWNIFLQA